MSALANLTSSSAPPEAPAERRSGLWLALAFAIPIAWFFVYNGLQREHLVDEGGHVGNVVHFLEGKPGWPEQMTMLPGYHFIVAALWKLGPPFSLLTLARLVSTGIALLGVAAFAVVWRRLHAQHPGRATLLFSLLPLLQPFTGMAYTDAPALAFVLLALAAHLAQRRFVAAVLFAAAACLRQTNLLWAAFVVALELSAAPATTTRSAASFLRRTGWLLLLLALGGLLVLRTGRVSVGTQTGTELRFNIATLHCAGLVVTLLALPAWFSAIPEAGRRWREAMRRRFVRTFAWTLLALALAVVGGLTFANPHPWNRELFWEGNTFTLLRNWPLVWLERHPPLRFLSGLNLVAAAAALTLTFARQRHRRALWLALVFGALLPAANNLVEPRYFIPGFALVLLWLELETATWRRLAWGWGILCALHAPFIAQGLSLW